MVLCENPLRENCHSSAKRDKLSKLMTSLQFLPNYARKLDNFEKFQWTRNSAIV